MPHKKQPAEYFKIIKKNHKAYLDKNMVPRLELMNALEEKETVEEYKKKLQFYQDNKNRYLNKLIRPESTMSNIGNGLMGALAGIGVGAFSYYALKSNPDSQIINPIANAKNMVAGIFSAALGAGAGYMAYNAMKKDDSSINTDYENFQKILAENGFSDEKFNDLSSKLVQLFHFRECVLLGLKDNLNKDMRKEFKELCRITDDKALNAAIEVYFLEQLELLLKEGFQEIYKFQENNINNEIKNTEENPIWTKFKRYFADEDKRKKFTEQFQLQFLNHCLEYIENKLIEPTFLAKYPRLTASIGGVIAGFIALSIIGASVTFFAIATPLIIALVTGVSIYLAVNHIDVLHYKRGKENRDAIEETTKNMEKESNRLKGLIKNVVNTDPIHVKQLEKFNKENDKNGFFSKLNPFVQEEKNIAMGASTSWIREYASRYQHSKLIIIDLGEQLGEKERGVIAKADKQTLDMQDCLKSFLKNNLLDQKFKNFIKDTKTYLSEPTNESFIKNFDLTEKIRLQILEIVSIIPVTEKLPKELSEFYTLPVDKGGLGGLEQDLNKVRTFAPIIDTQVQYDNSHPHYPLLLAGFQLDYARNKNESSEYILMGDSDYRDMLTLPITASEDRIEYKINAQNIKQYLNTSWDFLYSLNRPLRLDKLGELSDTHYENSHEFILYRMLLIKQLANLADPTNQRVDEIVRHEIKQFVKEKLQLAPGVDTQEVFDEVLNQALFIEIDNKGTSILNPYHEPCYTSNLDFIADAVRLDLALVSKNPITPNILIAQEAKKFLSNKEHDNKIIFNYHDSKKTLRFEDKKDYLTKITKAITLTNDFLIMLENRKVIKKSRILVNYVHDCKKEIDDLIDQIDISLKNTLLNQPHLISAKELLLKFSRELETKKEKLIEEHETEKKEFLQDLTPKDKEKIIPNKEEKSLDSEKVISIEEITDKEIPQKSQEESIRKSSNNYLNSNRNVSSYLNFGFFQQPSNNTEDNDKEAPNWELMLHNEKKQFNKLLNELVNKLQDYLEGKNQPDPFYKGWFDYSNKDKKEATSKLINALKDLEKGLNPDINFLNDKIYTNGVLSKTISEFLNDEHYSNLKQFFQKGLDLNKKIESVEEEGKKFNCN